jgi:hypothetical protein
MKQTAQSLCYRPGAPWYFRLSAITSLVLGCLLPITKAGTVSTDFDPSQTLPGTVYGSAATSATGGEPNGTGTCLQFDTLAGQSGFFLLNELDPGEQVQGFTANFNLMTGNTNLGANHGDGFSFSFIPGPAAQALAAAGVMARPPLGIDSGLTISFVTTGVHQEQTNTSETIQVRYNGQLLGIYSAPFINTGTNFEPVGITAHTNGNIDLAFGGHAVFTELYAFPPTEGQFCFAADSQAQVSVGDFVDLYWMDNLSITTEVTNGVALVSAAPLGTGVAPNAPIQVQLQNITTSLNVNTLALKVNGAAVASSALSIVKSGNINTITYTPAGNFAANATIPVVLTYKDNAAAPNSYTNNFSFTVYPYVTLPASYAVSPSTVTRDKNAYYIYLYESQNGAVGVTEAESIAIAEAEVAGAIVNEADLAGSNPDGGYSWPTNYTINFTTAANPGPGLFLGADNGSGGTLYPDSDLGSYNACEVLAYLQLARGTYTFGVDTVSNSAYFGVNGYPLPTEAGFKVSVGPSPRNVFAPVIASFDNSYPEGYQEFSFVVTNAGLYPFRVLDFSGPGNGAFEWYMNSNGARVDLATGLGASNVFGTAVISHPWLEYLPSPAPGDISVAPATPIQATVVNGTATVTTNTIVMTVNGVAVTPSLLSEAVFTTNPTSGNIITKTETVISYSEPGGLAAGSTNVVVVTYTDSGGLQQTNTWGFATLGAAKNPDLLVIEAEDWTTNFPSTDPPDNGSAYGSTDPGLADPNTGLTNIHEWVFGSATVTNYWSLNYGDFPTIVSAPSLWASNILGYSGRGYITCLPNVNANVGNDVYTNNGTGYTPFVGPITEPLNSTGVPISTAAGTAYNVYFADTNCNASGGQTYYLWGRGWGDASTGGGNNQNKSCHFGLDWSGQASSIHMGGGGPRQFAPNQWIWNNENSSAQVMFLQVTNVGWHVVNFWMREDGFVLDKFLLTTNPNFIPSDVGPAENLGSPAATGSIVLSIAKVAGGVQISWSGTGTLQSSSSLSGPFVNVTGGGSSPVTVTPGATQLFYRLIN